MKNAEARALVVMSATGAAIGVKAAIGAFLSSDCGRGPN